MYIVCAMEDIYCACINKIFNHQMDVGCPHQRDFPPELLFRTPCNPIFQAAKQHNFTLFFFSSIGISFQLRWLPLLCRVTHLHVFQSRGKAGLTRRKMLKSALQMSTVFSRHIHQHLLIRTLESSADAHFISLMDSVRELTFTPESAPFFYACLIHQAREDRNKPSVKEFFA